jgi:lycopene beta-cyclase
LRAALFHPTTGYSLPWAARLADRITLMPDMTAPALFAAIRSFSVAAWRDAGFYRLLNRLLFRAAEPDERYRLMQRFYALPPGVIGRFYAGQSTLRDKMRILTGKPPVPLLSALRCLSQGDGRALPMSVLL